MPQAPDRAACHSAPEMVLQLLLGVSMAQLRGVHQLLHILLIGLALGAQCIIVLAEPQQLRRQRAMDCTPNACSCHMARHDDLQSPVLQGVFVTLSRMHEWSIHHTASHAYKPHADLLQALIAPMQSG